MNQSPVAVYCTQCTAEAEEVARVRRGISSSPPPLFFFLLREGRVDSETLEFLADLEKSELVVDNENEATVPSGERPCPICGKQMMVDDEFGISVDVCEQHGIWLDRGELLSIIMRARSGDRISRRAAMKRAKDEGKIVGSMLGLWSLLLD